MGNLLPWDAVLCLVRKKGCIMDTLKFTAMPFGLTNAPAVFTELMSRRGSGAKRKLSRCGRNQMGNEPILALPEGAEDFVVYYDARSKDLKACLEKRRRALAIEETYMTKYSIHPGADTVLCGFRLTNRWLSIKGLQDCCYNLSYSSRSGEKTKDVIVKLPSLSSGYDAIGCSQWTDKVTPFLAMLRTGMVDFGGN
ncbi:hypothetical protein Tco_1066355 [Tanacetum coccineum]|uniref:Reverse transcriptase n=1 Tax=Tanacetum coccineum TaxID=301880 RepID=A0ABQ5HBV7_9ASTR